jgi:hypothetical protein
MSIESKQTLWVFGDSHTAGHGCTPYFEYYQKYYKEGDKTWPEHLSQYLDVNLVNRGKNGASNDFILDNIMESFDDIKEGDIVIIGKTYTHRFDVPQKDELIPIFWDWVEFAPDTIVSQFTQEEQEIIVNFLYHFMDSPLFEIRWDKRYKWIKSILEKRGCRVIVWDVRNELKRVQIIKVATKGKIDDAHMSFQGHFDFYTHMCNKWFKEKTLI